MENKTRRLAASALLIAVNVLLTRLLAINTPVMKIGLGFLALALAGLLYGPAWSALIGALGDLVGALLFPTGAYFPGFTITAAISGLIMGLCLYGRDVRRPWLPLLAAALNVVVVSFFCNSAMIAYISGTAFRAQLAVRAVQLVIMLPVQCAALLLLCRSDFIRRQIQHYRQ